MPASLGQRCLVVLGQIALPLIALIFYLDAGQDSQPIFMFVLLALGDLFNIFCICWNIWNCPEFQRFENYRQMFDFFFNLRKVYTVQLGCIFLKMIFEGFLFVHLVLQIVVPLWAIFAPFWLILSIILNDLTGILYRIQV